MWLIDVEVEQETSAPPPKKDPGSAPCTTQAFHLVAASVHTPSISAAKEIGVFTSFTKENR